MTTQKNLPSLGGAGARKNTQRSDGVPLQRVRSEALLGARGELVIEHAGREYRLRLTSTGKLILTA